LCRQGVPQAEADAPEQASGALYQGWGCFRAWLPVRCVHVCVCAPKQCVIRGGGAFVRVCVCACLCATCLCTQMRVCVCVCVYVCVCVSVPHSSILCLCASPINPVCTPTLVSPVIVPPHARTHALTSVLTHALTSVLTTSQL